MEQAWIIMGETYLLTIVISLFVAFLIHMMTLLIRRFGTGGEAVAGLGGAGRNIGTAG